MLRSTKIRKKRKFASTSRPFLKKGRDAVNHDIKFEKNKVLCPCGHGKNFVRIVGKDGGKCWSSHCRQKFFPSMANDRHKQPQSDENEKKEHTVGLAFSKRCKGIVFQSRKKGGT